MGIDRMNPLFEFVCVFLNGMFDNTGIFFSVVNSRVEEEGTVLEGITLPDMKKRA